MSDDLDLIERFEPLASAPFAAPTDTSVLAARVAQRRRKRRALTAGGVAAAVAVLGALGVLAAQAVPADDGPTDDVRAVAPTEPEPSSVPASYGTGPRLVLGSVPPGLSSEGCQTSIFSEGEIAGCELGVPATEVDDGMILLLRPASSEVQAAWAAGDTVALARLNVRDTASFSAIGGRDVLDLGETRTPDRHGRPDRVSRTYQVLSAGSTITIHAEGITDEQLDQVVGGLGTDPVDLGFATSVDALPAEARVIAQGQERLWYQPDPMDASRSDDNGGEVAGVTYAIGDGVAPLAVHVVRGVDAASYLDAWAEQQSGSEAPVQPVIANGRAGQLAHVQYGGIAAEAGEGSGERMAVAVDDGTVIIVEGRSSLHESLLAIAGRTRITPDAPVLGSGPDAPTPGSGEPAAATGWYIPKDLPDGWILDRGQSQVTDGAGEAQLWFTSPSGNVVVVTLKLPRPGEWHDEDAELHSLPGQAQPVYEEPERSNGPSYLSLRTMRPGAFVLIDLLGSPKGEEPTPAGSDETDELAAALAPVSADAWRAYLTSVPAPPDLLEAETLEDLPDGS